MKKSTNKVKHWEASKEKYLLFKSLFDKEQNKCDNRLFKFSVNFLAIIIFLGCIGLLGLLFAQAYLLLRSNERLSIGRYIALGITTIILLPFIFYMGFNDHVQTIAIGGKETYESKEAFESRGNIARKYDVSRMSYFKVKFLVGLMNFSMWYMQFITIILSLILVAIIIAIVYNIFDAISLKAIGAIIVILLIVGIILIAKKKK